MKLTLADPGFLKDSISVISELVNEGRFKITSSGIELIAMDPANVAMVIFKLFSSCFADYQLKKDVEITMNLNNLKQILRRAKPSDILVLELEDDRMNIILKSAQTRTFSLPIIESEEREQRVPTLEFPVIIKTSCSLLAESIEDVGIVSESVAFATDGNKLFIKAEGDLNKANIEIPKDKDTEIIAPEEKIQAKYSVEYLKKMMSGGKLADRVEIKFNKDYPLKLEYKVVDRVLLAFILAPRVENE